MTTATLYTRDGTRTLVAEQMLPNNEPSVIVWGKFGARQFRTAELGEHGWLTGQAQRGIAYVRKYCRLHGIKVPRLRGESA